MNDDEIKTIKELVFENNDSPLVYYRVCELLDGDGVMEAAEKGG